MTLRREELLAADEADGNVARSLFDVDTPDDRDRATEMLGADEARPETEVLHQP